MARSLSLTADMVTTARALAPRAWVLGLAAAVCLAVAWLADGRLVQLAGLAAGAGLGAAALALRALAGAAGLSDRRLMGRLGALVGADAAPCFTTDEIGAIGYANEAARDRFRTAEGATLASALGDHFANPAAVLFRLQSRAANLGAAREDVVTRRGHMRLSVHRIAPRQFLWRIEEFVERAASGRGGGGVSLPMLVANKAGVVLFSNEAMRRLAGERPRRLDRIFATPVLHSGEEVEIATAEGPVRAYLAEIEGPGERREIYLLPVPERTEADHMLADFEHVPVALLKFRPDGTLRAANRAARELAGDAAGDQRRFEEIFEGPGRPAAEWLEDVLAERLPGASEVVPLRGGGEVFLQVTLRRLVEGGRPGVLAVVQDATAMKTLETQFVQSQKMQAIGQLAGGIAHDFNNLLTAISGHADLLLLRRGPDDPEYADLVQIRQTTNRAAALVGQLLAFSRKQTLKPERIDLQDVLADLTHLLNRLVGGRLRLQLAHAPDLGAIRADKRQIEQVMMNLVVNARDAMPEGGTIRIETEAMTLREDLHRGRAVVPAGDYAVIRVQDSGVGIPADRHDKIFEPFYTTKRVGEGTGLGLSTVYGIVKQSGGFIFVESEVGRGSTFELYFPVNGVLPDEAEAQASGAAHHLLVPLADAAGVVPAAERAPAHDEGQAARIIVAPDAEAAQHIAGARDPGTQADEGLPVLSFGSRRGAAEPAGTGAQAPAAPGMSAEPPDGVPDTVDELRRVLRGLAADPAGAGTPGAGVGSEASDDVAPEAAAPSDSLGRQMQTSAADEAAGREPVSASPADPGFRAETPPAPIAARAAQGGPVEGDLPAVGPGSVVPAEPAPGHAPDPAMPSDPTADLGRGPLRSASRPGLADMPGGRVVLLVEDEAPVRAFAARALQLRGFRVLEASSAEEALAILADPEVRVDVFVTDVMMPGMDGPSWVRQALDDRPDVRVIFVSGFAEDQVDRACSRIPGATFLPKPFSLGDLTALVQGQFLH